MFTLENDKITALTNLPGFWRGNISYEDEEKNH